jgi:hypothetical protein
MFGIAVLSSFVGAEHGIECAGVKHLAPAKAKGPDNGRRNAPDQEDGG